MISRKREQQAFSFFVYKCKKSALMNMDHVLEMNILASDAKEVL